MKTCSNCCGPGPFGRSKYNKDGLKSHCKKCCAEKQKAYTAQHPEIWAVWATANAGHLKARDASRYAADPKAAVARVLVWQAKNPEKVQSTQLRYLYGITLADKQALFTRQGGKCPICDDPLTTGRTGMQVDHDHETGEVRGLLCHPCNVMLGNFGDDPAILESAIAYLLRGPATGLTPQERPPGVGYQSRGTRAGNLWYLYGLTAVTFQELLDRQGNECAICSGPLGPGQRTHIDHDHSFPRTVRGLLCRFCNPGLGHARENPSILRASVAYLGAHRQAA